MKQHQTILNLAVAALLGVLIGATPRAVRGQTDATSSSWNQPVEPFRIIGNIYYVGAADLTSYLFVTPAGDILLDGGLVETAPQVEANIGKLGFRLGDVKILLNSHAHYDHAGGLAELKRATGAKFYASAGDAPVLESGGRADATLRDPMTFPPIKPDAILRDGEKISLGGTTLTAHLTPGHTKGCTTWTTTVEDGGKPYHVVFVCSTSVLSGIPLIHNSAYPNIASDYERTFRVLRSLPCDVFLGAHGSFFDLTDKRKALRQGAKTNPFVDPAGYRAYLDRSEAEFEQDLRRQGEQAKAKAGDGGNE
jgi:metallo-beta-lactamase class B